MFEELYAPLPETDAFFERLELKPTGDLSRETLDQLIFSYQTHVVFENLNSWLLHTPVSLATGDLFRKIILQKRGGYCFEMNGLFTQFLKDLGFQAHSCMCRIIGGRDRSEPASIMHRGIIVSLEGVPHYCDVGFGGPMPAGALPLNDGGSRTIQGETFHTRKLTADWWCVSRTTSAGTVEDVLDFFPMEQEVLDFLPFNTFCSTNPASIFTQQAFFNLRTEHGSRSILGNSYTVTENGTARQQTISTMHELFRILEEDFHFVPAL